MLLHVIEMGDRGGPPTDMVPTISVTPDTSGVGLLEFHQIDVAREAGRRAGEAVVAAVRKSQVVDLTTTVDTRVEGSRATSQTARW
jgi:hypothetical protein